MDELAEFSPEHILLRVSFPKGSHRLRPYERCWLEAEDGERFAFDWVFPPGGSDLSVHPTVSEPQKIYRMGKAANMFISKQLWLLWSTVVSLLPRGFDPQQPVLVLLTGLAPWPLAHLLLHFVWIL